MKNNMIEKPDPETDWIIVVDDDLFTYEVKKQRDHAYGELCFEEPPMGPLFLVRVKGKDGGSFETRPAAWNVEAFAARDEAEALADAIDFNIDLRAVLKHWEFAVPHGLKDPERIARLQEAHVKAGDLGQAKRAGVLSKKASIVTYKRSGKPQRINVEYLWCGFFAEFERVDVVEIHPKGQGRRRRSR